MKKSLTILVAALAALSAGAATLTPEQALARLGSDGQARVAGGRMDLVMTENFSGTSIPALYVFNSDNGGYVVVSADDRAVPMLGYSNDGAIDADNMAPALKYWLGEYARQIANAVPVTEPAPKSPNKAERQPIEPMVQTHWDQDAPYNNDCPTITGTRTYTGCVATAMAQVMKYHNYPEQGQGSHSYYWTRGAKTLSLDFSSLTFNWNLMLDSYTSASSAASQSAVATLMKACGIAVDMNYGTSASGAVSELVPYALYDYFKYSKSVSYCNRNYYSIEEWDNLIYTQLSNGPIYYSGQSNDGGHAFVCDGYSSNGYYHFNWGWSGISDGYYRLLALDPEQQGIGGSTSGFNFMQAITGGVRVPAEDDAPVYNFTCSGMNTGLPKSGNLGSAVKVNVEIVNVCVAPVTIQSGVKIVPENGEPFYVESNAYTTEVAAQSSTKLVSVTFPETMETGVYKIYPAVCDEEGNWYDVHVNQSGCRYLIGTVANGKISLAKSDATAVAVQNFELVSPMYVNRPFEVKAQLVNNSDGDYIGIVAPVLYRNGAAYAYGDYTGVEIPAGETQEFDYFGKFTRGTNPGAGSYQLSLVDVSTGKSICGNIDVTIKSGATTGKIKVNNFSFVGDANNADSANLNFNIEINCTSGYFSDRLKVVVTPQLSSVKVGEIRTQPIFAESGSTQTVLVNGALENLTIGTKYRASVYSTTRLSEYVTFKIGTSGIEIIEEESDLLLYPNPTSGIVNLSSTSDAEVYSVSGALVMSVCNVDTLDLTALPSGLYLVKAGNKVHRVIKK